MNAGQYEISKINLQQLDRTATMAKLWLTETDSQSRYASDSASPSAATHVANPVLVQVQTARPRRRSDQHFPELDVEVAVMLTPHKLVPLHLAGRETIPGRNSMIRSLSPMRRDASRGFTLLELIIVLVVLIALAALVVPLLGWVRKQAEFATGAAGAAEAMNNLELYRSATGKYPDRFDSLIKDQQLYLTEQVSGASVWSGDVTLTSVCRVSTPAENTLINYYLRNDGGIASVVNHMGGTDSFGVTIAPNVSTQTSPVYDIYTTEMVPGPTGGTDTDGDGTPDPVAQSAVRFALVSNTASSMSATRNRIIRAAYPNQTGTAGSATIPANHFLLAVGIGERCSAVGSTMSSAPQYSGASSMKYGRYIAFFDCWAGPSGRGKVQLKLVTDPTFTTIARATDLYKGGGPTDDQGVTP